MAQEDKKRAERSQAVMGRIKKLSKEAHVEMAKQRYVQGR